MGYLPTAASSTILWVLCSAVICLVVLQALIFLRMTLKFSDSYSILRADEKWKIYKTATINSIGPAVAIFFVAIGLIAIIGGPVTLMRLGVIGNVIFETIAAKQGAEAMGATLGTDSLNDVAFTAAVWVMSLGGMGWLISTFILTKNIDRVQNILSGRNPFLVKALGMVTPVAIFFTSTMYEALNKVSLSEITVVADKASAIVAAAASITVFRHLGKRASWLREWGLGFSLIVGLVAGYLGNLVFM